MLEELKIITLFKVAFLLPFSHFSANEQYNEQNIVILNFSKGKWSRI